MAITYRPQDKYAFLFTGPTQDRFMKDLENVFQTLTEYYNYPPGNIMVVLGSTPTTMPAFTGATVVNITSVANLDTALTNFASMASGPALGLPPPANLNTALLFFTGGGIREGTPLVSKLVIDNGPGSNNIDPTWLTTRLNAISDCHVNVVMQQSFSGGFLSALTGSSLIQWSFTYACTDSQDSLGNNTQGSFFTYGWIKGLKLETLPTGTPDAGKYADELGSLSEATNRQISLEEAKEFGKQIHDSMGFSGFSTPGYDGAGGPQYLGLPAFLIQDGTPWWESPDIYLTYPNHPWVPAGDLYIPDTIGAIAPFNNTINVDVRNKGTHPVRAYSLGIELFKTGTGPASDQHTACDIIPSSGIMLPMDLTDIGTVNDKKETYQWNTPFYAGITHICVTAEAELLCSNVDFSWSVLSEQSEAQRNIDEMTIIPPPPPPLPFPTIQGFKEHIYGIQNRFDETRKFMLLFPENYKGFEEILEMKWFEVTPGPNSERIPLEVFEEPVLHIPFDLKGGENKDILLQAKMKPNFAMEQGIRLPFEILAEGEWQNARPATGMVHLPNFASIGGFTVIIKKGNATIKGLVLDRLEKAAAQAKIFLRTVNDLQGAAITTDKQGTFTLPEINPDIYFIWAENSNWHSKQQTAVLLTGKEEEIKLHLTEEIPIEGKPVKVILDKIRIMNDQDPCIKGKGELSFTSVIVPDNDDSRKQVTRLPATGVYQVSDKPGENEIRLGVTLFDGMVKNRSLSISISGKEIDTFDPSDELNRYHRVFSGDPDTWYGEYYPGDEYLDREDVADWALWYRIVGE